MAPASKDMFVDSGLLNSLQSKYLYLVGCLTPNALDQGQMLKNLQVLEQLEVASGKKNVNKIIKNFQQNNQNLNDSVSTTSSKLRNRLRDTSSQAKLSSNSKLKLNYDDGIS